MRAGSTATTMNLSLLLSDFYSVLVGVGLLGSRPTGWYALAFCCVVGGLLGYHAGSRPKATADGTGSPLAEDLLPVGTMKLRLLQYVDATGNQFTTR